MPKKIKWSTDKGRVIKEHVPKKKEIRDIQTLRPFKDAADLYKRQVLTTDFPTQCTNTIFPVRALPRTYTTKKKTAVKNAQPIKMPPTEYETNSERQEIVLPEIARTCTFIDNPDLHGTQSEHSKEQRVHQRRKNNLEELANIPGQKTSLPPTTCIDSPSSIDYDGSSNISRSKKAKSFGKNKQSQQHISIALDSNLLFNPQRFDDEETPLDMPSQATINILSQKNRSTNNNDGFDLGFDELLNNNRKDSLESHGKQANSLVFNHEELEHLDAAGFPEPKTTAALDTIMRLFHAAVNEPDVVCCVCDQFLRISGSTLVSPACLPPAFFTKLQQPTGKNGDAEVLHPILLAQYRVSDLFPNYRSLFANLLLSPRGIEKHRLDCTANGTTACSCEPQLRMCTKTCFACLKHGSLPKFAIANGLWIGQLPENLRNMTLGTRSLVRPVHSTGHLIAYSPKNYIGGTSITGHIYSNRLDTPLVHKSFPMDPSTVPLKAIVVSPFAKDETIIHKAKIASMQKNYVVTREQVMETIECYKQFGNKVMLPIGFNKEVYDKLPDNDILPAMFAMPPNEQLDSEPNDTVPHSDDDTVIENESSCGGSSLLRTNKEIEEIVITSATVTIGGETPHDSNSHEKVVQALSGAAVLFPEETSSQIHVVRPDTTFISDSDRNYLEIHYPDLLPFGRGGFAEKRRIKISRKAMLAYMLNLSTRQFQEVDFVLPMYDMVTRQQVSTLGFVRSKIPSRNRNADGTQSSKAEAFGQISTEDMKKVCEHKINCVKAASKGAALPPPPSGLNGVASEFFNDVTTATKNNQHSLAASAANRGGVYAAHNSLGKAHIWFTFCPDDTMSYKIMWYALAPGQSTIYKDSIPTGTIRFETLSNHPVAGALNFERCLEIAIEYLIGWDTKTGAPLKNRGVWGTPSGHLRIVEEQFRLTLHSHHLIWLHGHQDIEAQLKSAQKLSNATNEIRTANLPQTEALPMTTSNIECAYQNKRENISDQLFQNQTDSNKLPDIPMIFNSLNDGHTTTYSNGEEIHLESSHLTDMPLQLNAGVSQHDTTNANALEILLQRFKDTIDSYAVGELLLPLTEAEAITKCFAANCTGELQLNTEKMLYKMRNRPVVSATEAKALKCDQCSTCYCISETINAALDRGFQRCFNRSKLSEQETQTLIWQQLRVKPLPDADPLEIDRWMLHLSSIQVFVNLHDWRHRESCFKNGRKQCRYNTPHLPVEKTMVDPVFAINLDPETEKYPPPDQLNDPIVQLNINLKKRTPFLFLTDCNIYALAVFNCNNCTRYVENQKVSLYYGAYASKHTTENEKALAEMLRALTAYEEKVEKRRLLAESNEDIEINCSVAQRPTATSIGLGRLLSAARAPTNGETVGALLAAFAARGNLIFDMSHSTAILPLTQTLAYLEAKPIVTNIHKKGQVFSTIHDYVYRNSLFEEMNFWTFTANQKIVPNRKNDNIENDETDTPSEIGADNSTTDDSKKTKWQRHDFLPGHPNKATHKHQQRQRKCWPIYRAQRLGDTVDLNTKQNDHSDRPAEIQRAAKRELYAQGALIMFKPFRSLPDLYQEDDGNWWNAYLRNRSRLEENSNTVTVLNNMQNYYESFCRSGTITTEPEFPNDVDPHRQRQEAHSDEDANIALDLLEGEQALEATDTAEETTIEDPLVSKLANFHESLFSVAPRNPSFSRVTQQQAKIAISLLPSKKRKQGFSLPGRARVDVETPETIQEDQPSEPKKARLDYFISTRVDLLSKIEEALLQTHFTPFPNDGSAPIRLEANFPTMKEHSNHWQLNEKQHLSFVLIAAALLKHILDANRPDQTQLATAMGRMSTNIDILLSSILPQTGQLILYLGGSGGTGKSRVIQTFIDFARRWHSIASHVICASSGVAAILIGGCTLNTALGIAINLNPPEPNNNHIQAWSEIGVMILDEFSMVSPALFALMDSRLRKIKGRLDKPFGGIHIVLCGDFYQLPPVGSSIIKPPTQTENAKDKDASLSMVGRHLWKTLLTDVIELNENHRQTDKPWAAALERWRINQPTNEDIISVNSRHIDHLDPVLQCPPAQTITAVSQNNSRETGLRFFEKRINNTNSENCLGNQEWDSRGILLIRARISQKEAHSKVRPEQENYIRGLSEKRLGFPGNLICIIGAPYMVTLNADVSKAVANGTMCYLLDVTLRDDAQVHIHSNRDGTQMHAVYADEVLCLLFHHRLAEFKSTLTFDSLPPGCFPVITTTKGIRCKLGKTDKTFSVSLTQFPCTLAFILTGHKLQAQTLNSIILGALSPTHQYGSTGWIYVVLSRVRTLAGLFLLVKLCEDSKKFKPRLIVMREMERLRAIETKTLNRLRIIL